MAKNAIDSKILTAALMQSLARFDVEGGLKALRVGLLDAIEGRLPAGFFVMAT